MRLALIGFGNVGQAFARLLKKKQKLHPLRIVAVQTARHGTAYAPDGLGGEPEFGEAAGSIGEFLDRAAADIAVELTTLDPTSGEPAITHIREAFARGMHVVTANKGPIAFAFHELSEAARAARVHFRFESTTMDGTPVFNLVRKSLPDIEIAGFAGALNSTSKVVIDFLRQGMSMDDGIREAQRLGIAESDPWFDLDGWDSACKAAALANVLMDARTTPAQVERRGIGHLTPEKVQHLAATGKAVALISRGKKSKDGVKLRVRAEVIDRDDVFAAMKGTSNLLQLQTDLMGEIGVYSVNPGVEQTAYGVYSDVVDILRSR